MPTYVTDLIELGRLWLSKIHYCNFEDKKIERTEANKVAAEIKAGLERLDGITAITVRVSCFQAYELLVYVGGKAYRYDDFISVFDKDMEVTAWLLEFIRGDRAIDDFSGRKIYSNKKILVQAFVAIVFIAEYGRGYTISDDWLIKFLSNILNGTDHWTNLKSSYPPALKYAEDERKDYKPSSQEESEEEYEEDYEEDYL